MKIAVAAAAVAAEVATKSPQRILFSKGGASKGAPPFFELTMGHGSVCSNNTAQFFKQDDGFVPFIRLLEAYDGDKLPVVDFIGIAKCLVDTPLVAFR